MSDFFFFCLFFFLLLTYKKNVGVNGQADAHRERAAHTITPLAFFNCCSPQFVSRSTLYLRGERAEKEASTAARRDGAPLQLLRVIESRQGTAWLLAHAVEAVVRLPACEEPRLPRLSGGHT